MITRDYESSTIDYTTLHHNPNQIEQVYICRICAELMANARNSPHDAPTKDLAYEPITM